jgi:hypothetical protein
MMGGCVEGCPETCGVPSPKQGTYFGEKRIYCEIMHMIAVKKRASLKALFLI